MIIRLAASYRCATPTRARRTWKSATLARARRWYWSTGPEPAVVNLGSPDRHVAPLVVPLSKSAISRVGAAGACQRSGMLEEDEGDQGR